MIKAKKTRFLYLIYAFTSSSFFVSLQVKADIKNNISLACCIYENEALLNPGSEDAIKLTCQKSLNTLVENQNLEQENLYHSVRRALGSSEEKSERDLYKALQGSYNNQAKSFLAKHEALKFAYEAKYGRACELQEEAGFKVFTASNNGGGHQYAGKHPKYTHNRKKKKKKKDNEPDAISFGMLVGANITSYNLSGSSRSYDPKSIVGFQAGVTIMWFFSDSFGVGTGALYQKRGVEFYDGSYDLATRDFHFLEVPLTVGYDMHHIIKVYGGAQFSYFLSGTRKSKTLGTSDVTKDQMTSLTMGATVGALFHVLDDLYFDMSYVHGLQDEIKNITNQRRTFQFGFAYYF